MRIAKYLIPLAIFLVLTGFLFKGLSKDPSQVPSPLVNKAAPAFSLPVLGSPTTFSPEQFLGRVWLLNVWGSWCAACLIEHPLFNEASKNGSLTLVGLAWKDREDASRAWLVRHGNPYEVVVSDLVGDTAIDYGVYGAPESFLIDKKGIIRFKKTGPFSPEEFNEVLLPMVAQLEKE